MRYFLAAAVLAATTSGQSGPGCTNDNNNWYCALVDAITYTEVGGTGSYTRIMSMDSNSNTCAGLAQEYSGSMSPLNEEVSWHFRGPLQLTQFAAYTPGSPTAKKTKRNEHIRRHAHAHAQAHNRRHDAREVGDMVTATIDGIVQSWVNHYTGATDAAVSNAGASAAPIASAAASVSSSYPAESSAAATGDGWGRQAYYSANDSTADGLVFLNHNGGSGSGVFDYTFGNSLSYASSDGTEGASSPQTLAATTLPSSAEIIIMTDKECNADDESCGFYRPGTVAYHGFDGASKAFFFEFSMPNDGQTTTDIYDPVNMPAIWMLNAQIPRTLQYGNPECSCWTSGCGEFDMFEVLAPGEWRAKSTLHGNIAGGDSNYFARPESEPIKVAMVLYDDNIHIKVLDYNTEFSSNMDASIINDIVGSTMQQSDTVSLFNLAGAAAGKL